MLRQHLETARIELAQMQRILEFTHNAREPVGEGEPQPALAAIDQTYWRAFDHCAAMVRLYATFERYVIDVVSVWIEWCLSNSPSTILANPDSRMRYEYGLSEILRRRDSRFEDVDRRKLAEGLALFHVEPIPEQPRLALEPFFAAQPNLRLQHVSELFRHAGLNGVMDWLLSDVPLTELCEEEGFGLEAEFKQLVDRRNEAAHGNSLPVDIFGITELRTRLRLVTLTCQALFDFVVAAICRKELAVAGGAVLIGNVTHLWPGPAAFELVTAGLAVAVGDRFVAISERRCMVDSILSIQLEGAPAAAHPGTAGVALGMQATSMPDEGMQLLSFSKIRGLGQII
jgi:hypothetical protein